MALPRLLVFFLFSTLFYTVIALAEQSADGISAAASEAETEDSDASLRAELNILKSKISLLVCQIESKIGERMQELESKKKTIGELEMIIEEKSNSLTSLQSQMQLLKEKASLNAEEQQWRANEHTVELEEQITNLRKEIEAQNKKKDALEARTTIAERKIQDMHLELENLHKTNDEQKSRILNTQGDLELAEEELLKAKFEASSSPKEQIEVLEAWIPAWIVVHLDYFQSFLVSNWNRHGRPALDMTKEKALQKKCELENWMKPHLDTFKSEWVLIIREYWLTSVNNFGLHLQFLTNMAIDKYHVTWQSVEPHLVRLQQMMDPYFQVYLFGHIYSIYPSYYLYENLNRTNIQEVKKFTEPYPGIDKTGAILKPYMKILLLGYKKFVGEVNILHLHLDIFSVIQNSAILHYFQICHQLLRVKREGKKDQEWVLIIREYWLTSVNNFGLHLQFLTNMAIDKYHVTWQSVEPHLVRLQQMMDPYFQEVKKFTEPYLGIDKTGAILKPYMKILLLGYKKFVGEVNILHLQVEATILDILKGHEFTRPLATTQLVWYMASALMAVALIFMFNMSLALFR